MRRIAGVTVLVLLAVGLFSCSKNGEDTIRVGLIAELTGDLPAVGASSKNATEMAVQAINDKGGISIGGVKRKIELIIEDNSGRSEQSVTAAQKLITQKNVVAIIGPNASRYAIPAAEIAETYHVPLITPWSTDPHTTLNPRDGSPRQYVFRACYVNTFLGRVLAKFARETLKVHRVAILFDTASDANKSISEIFKKSFEDMGGIIPAFESYTTGDKDFSAQLTKIKAENPDIIFLPNYYSEVPMQIQQAKRLGITAPFFGNDAWGSHELIKLCGKDCDGYFFNTHYASDIETASSKEFVGKYEALYGTLPDDVAALSWDAFGLLAKALETSNKIDRSAIRDALAGIRDYDGVTGKIQFTGKSGDPEKSVVLVRINDGKFVWFANVTP